MSNPSSSLLLGPIIGGLSHVGVNLWARAKPTNSKNLKLYAWLGHNPDLSDAVLLGASLPLSPENGFAGVAPVRGLSPQTRYHYSLTLREYPPEIGDGPLGGGLYPSFTTFPPPGKPASFNFSFGSCFRPIDQYSGRIFHSIERIRQRHDLKFMLFIGDQVYADDYKTNSLGKVAESLEEYRRVYEYVWSYSSIRRLFWTLPAFMILDDHEVDDDWRWQDRDRRTPSIPWWNTFIRWKDRRPRAEHLLTEKRVKAALKANWEHQAIHAPAMLHSPALDEKEIYSLSQDDPGSLAYTFEYGPAAFFVMDTRTMRVKTTFGPESTMLGDDQWIQLENWLLGVKDRYLVKFLVSSSSLLYSSWIDIPQDRWSGFKSERDRLLHFIAVNGIENVFILSGDFHFGYAIRADLHVPFNKPLHLWEFCSSPFEQKIGKWVARTRKGIRNGLIKRQELLFTVLENNFGVVNVMIEDHQAPCVKFELFDKNGRRIGGVDPIRLEF